MISNYAGKQILNAMTGRDSSVYLANPCYLALSSTEPQKDGTGVTEPSGNGYARKLIGQSNYSSYWMMGEPKDNVSTNDKEIHFDEATGDWPNTYQWVCIYNQSTGGNLIAWGKLSTAITVKANTVPLIRVGQLTISILDE